MFGAWQVTYKGLGPFGFNQLAAQEGKEVYESIDAEPNIKGGRSET